MKVYNIFDKKTNSLIGKVFASAVRFNGQAAIFLQSEGWPVATVNLTKSYFCEPLGGKEEA